MDAADRAAGPPAGRALSPPDPAGPAGAGVAEVPLAGDPGGAFRGALSRFPTGVTVLTTLVEGMHQGLTANSFTSVSLDPPLVLVCVQRSARFHDAVLRAGVWGVSVLTAQMRAVSEVFARHGRPWHPGQFDPYPHHVGERTGCLLLDEAAATFECRTWATCDGGDHTVVIGEVLAFADRSAGRPPLLYAEGDYRLLPPSGPNRPD